MTEEQYEVLVELLTRIHDMLLQSQRRTLIQDNFTRIDEREHLQETFANLVRELSKFNAYRRKPLVERWILDPFRRWMRKIHLR